ncbi:hypothetical protein [Caballeronia sp. LZ035]|uniref:hypothetical protein n=1 Tax=Caballeronia sp. LZ035 TaxID=3038568 RepID=UPI002857305B|nr:hypothetical protein [Caballeronia sp. LZ035]MDR5763440.1 hypothetical protein [Caballeronia sp. LZ035]
MPYTIDPLSIQFTETRHGINATARILLDGKKVGTIHDHTERIVTDVTFTTEEDRFAFAAEARRVLVTVFGKANHHDSAFISEYARALLKQAEDELLKRSRDDRLSDDGA